MYIRTVDRCLPTYLQYSTVVTDFLVKVMVPIQLE